MKTMIMALILTLTTQVFAVNRINCMASSESKVTIIKAQSENSYEINIASDLSSDFIGAIEDRIVTATPTDTADVLTDWNGTSGVKISFHKGFLSSSIGTTSKSFLTVTYNDIATDRVSHPLNCVVTGP